MSLLYVALQNTSSGKSPCIIYLLGVPTLTPTQNEQPLHAAAAHTTFSLLGWWVQLASLELSSLGGNVA